MSFHFTILLLLGFLLPEFLSGPGHDDGEDDYDEEEVCNPKKDTGRQDGRVALIFCICCIHIFPWPITSWHLPLAFTLWDATVLPGPSLPGKTPNFVSLNCAEFFGFTGVPAVVVVVVGHHPL